MLLPAILKVVVLHRPKQRSWKRDNNICHVVLGSTLLLWFLHCCYLAKPLMLLEHFSALAGEEGRKNAQQAVSDLRKLSFIVTDHGAPEVDRCPCGARQQAQRFSSLLSFLSFFIPTTFGSAVPFISPPVLSLFVLGDGEDPRSLLQRT